MFLLLLFILLLLLMFNDIILQHVVPYSFFAGGIAMLVAVVAFPLEEITPGKVLWFPIVKTVSKTTEHTEAAREERAEYGRREPLEN